MKFGEDRSPLDYGSQGSKTQVLLVCPNCNLGRWCDRDVIAIICGGCKNKFTSQESLSSHMANGMINIGKRLTREYVKFRDNMERKAYEWKGVQDAKRSAGTLRRHAPPQRKNQ